MFNQEWYEMIAYTSVKNNTTSPKPSKNPTLGYLPFPSLTYQPRANQQTQLP